MEGRIARMNYSIACRSLNINADDMNGLFIITRHQRFREDERIKDVYEKLSLSAKIVADMILGNRYHGPSEAKYLALCCIKAWG
jgi:hypothetical protein